MTVWACPCLRLNCVSCSTVRVNALSLLPLSQYLSHSQYVFDSHSFSVSLSFSFFPLLILNLSLPFSLEIKQTFFIGDYEESVGMVFVCLETSRISIAINFHQRHIEKWKEDNAVVSSNMLLFVFFFLIESLNFCGFFVRLDLERWAQQASLLKLEPCVESSDNGGYQKLFSVVVILFDFPQTNSPGPNPMNSIQACIYQKITCIHKFLWNYDIMKHFHLYLQRNFTFIWHKWTRFVNTIKPLIIIITQ